MAAAMSTPWLYWQQAELAKQWVDLLESQKEAPVKQNTGQCDGLAAVRSIGGVRRSVVAEEKKTQSTPKKRSLEDTKLDLNAASAKELTTVPGLGDAMIKLLMAARPFADWDDVMRRVRGFGPKNREWTEPFLVIGEAKPKPRRSRKAKAEAEEAA
jgi:DNA uptake protein ComE-like DNA-binding protein